MSQRSPATPSRGKAVASADPGCKETVRLNQIYNLGVPQPDGVMSPVAKDKQALQDVEFRRHNSIVHTLRILYYKDKDLLQAALDEFDAKVRQSTNWARKPRARAAGPPRAYVAEDKVMLQELLLEVLTTAKDSLNGNTTQGTHATRDAATTSPVSRSSAVEAAASASSAAEIDRVPVFPIVNNALLQPEPQNTGAEAWEKSFWNERERASGTSTRSSSKSTAMFSALDSLEEPFESQPSTAADTEDAKSFSGTLLRRSASQESFPISDTSLDALEESFNLYGDGATAGSVVPGIPGSPTSSTYSSIPEMAALQLFDHEEDNSTLLSYEQVPGLFHRLTLVFRQSPMPTSPFLFLLPI